MILLVEVVYKGGGWEERDRRFILWYFEELLKERYKEFIEVLEVMIYLVVFYNFVIVVK